MSPSSLYPASIARLALGSDPVRRAIYIAGMTPAVWYFYCGLVDELGADPQKTLERVLGLWALRYLIACLSITPLRRLRGPNLLRYRRAVGLLAFYYASLHLGVYLLLDQGLDLVAIWADIVKRPFITIGLMAFVVLLPLAATSNAAMIRRLGARWQRLHRFVYLAAVAAAAHFIMVVKAWPPEPLLYAGVLSALLLFRLRFIRKRVAAPMRGRNNLSMRQAN